jgi:uncharacterized membrane protein
MTGLILAGAAPLQAVLVQAVVMLLVLAATATTTVVIAIGLIRRLFTPTTGSCTCPPSPTAKTAPAAGQNLPFCTRQGCRTDKQQSVRRISHAARAPIRHCL